MAGKLGIFQPDPAVPQYRLVVFPGKRGVPAAVEDEVFTSLNAAYHAVFLRRIAQLQAE